MSICRGQFVKLNDSNQLALARHPQLRATFKNEESHWTLLNLYQYCFRLENLHIQN